MMEEQGGDSGGAGREEDRVQGYCGCFVGTKDCVLGEKLALVCERIVC